MCGIAGILSFGEMRAEMRSLKKMTDAIAHRGPDGEGYWNSDDEKVGFGHRRLSIIDLSPRANQPMSYLERYTITFNGEIYNYKELKADLVKSGYQFNSDSDTEVLLALYDQKGEKALPDLDGMFAFAIWDQADKKLFCARDRFGEKPFYYHVSEKGFCFASEMKALFATGVPVEVDKFMLSNFLLTDLVVNPDDESQTFYKGIKKLPKSCSLTVTPGGKLTIEKYYQVNLTPNTDSFEEAIEKVRKMLSDSVRFRLRSDVPVSSSLSGGIDSAIIEALVRAELKKSNSIFENITFSARFNEKNFTENEFLDDAIKAGNSKNFSVFPDYKLIFKDLEKNFYHQEEPFWSASMLNHYAVMRLVAEHQVPVILEGQGADEMFAGYSWHKRVFLQELFKRSKKKYNEEIRHYSRTDRIDVTGRVKAFSPSLYKLIHQSVHALKRIPFLSSGSTREWRGLIPDSFLNVHKSGCCYVRPNVSGLRDMLLDDLNRYYLESLLRVGDRNSMAFGREVRLPFLDHKLVDFAFGLPAEYKIKDGWKKMILRKAFEPDIPASITWRKEKIGYAAPQEKWMQEPDNVKFISEAIHTLVENGWLRKGVVVPAKFHWKILMLYGVLKFSKTDFTKC